MVGKLLSQQSQISTVQRLKFLLRAKFFKLKLLLMPLVQNRLAQAVVFCGRGTLKGPKTCMWLVVSRSLPTTGLGDPQAYETCSLLRVDPKTRTCPAVPPLKPKQGKARETVIFPTKALGLEEWEF